MSGPVTCAAGKGDMPTIQFLLDHGSLIDEKDKLGATAIDWAKSKTKDDAVKFLSNYKAKSKTSPKSDTFKPSQLEEKLIKVKNHLSHLQKSLVQLHQGCIALKQKIKT